MSVKNNNNNNGSGGGSGSAASARGGGGEIIRAGLLKKLKTAKRKWFVLRAETPDASARLEYYDSEKKFHNGVAPKRSIPLKTCFNINRRFDTKHKHVIALYTKDDRFCIVLESEEELDAWLKALLSLQFPGMETPDGEMPRPNFEHIWQVTILNRGLGTGRTGNYRLCLTDKTLTLIRNGNNSVIDLNLSNIRSCGSLKNYFFLEIGRSSQLGAGELWMESEDTNIAQNIHLTIYHAMSSNTTNKEKDDLGPKTRNRSSSDTSKPNNACRKPGNVTKPHVFSQEPHVTSCSSNSNTAAITPHVHPPTASGGLPCPGTTTISHQRTQSLPLTDHSAPITDNTPIHPTTTTTTTTTTARTTNKRPNQSSAKSISGMRDRSDSVPSRPRTTSEGTHPMSTWRHGLTPHRSHGRDISHSPTSGSPVSPPSVGCSTDSTGSSYSLADEPDGYMDCSESVRYPIPLTPDEAIEEEDYPESPCGKHDRYVPMAPQSSDDGYVDMSPRYHPNAHSPTASLSSITSGTPSTDMRFSDYPLDKVSSYLLSEDDEDRPARAYSVGSRPETFRNKRQMELASAPDSSRCRAFSVGSKTKKGPSRVLPPHHPHHGIKSSSAPILSNSRTYSSHSSIGPMDDLMELDFSRSNTGSSINSGYIEMKPGGSNNNNNKAATPSGYVEMKPGVELAQKKISQSSDVSPYVDMSSSRGSGYMDMSGCSPSRTSNMSPQSESFVDINRQYRFTSSDLPRNNNYVDMDNRRNKTVSSPGAFNWNGDDYLDMSVNQQRLSQSSQMSSSPHNSDYAPLDFATSQVRTPEGYVEMSLGNKRHQRQPSLENCINEEYTNMSLGAKKKATKKASQPISISTSTTATQPSKNSSSPISIGSFLGRKPSVGTSPKMHLPLSWNTSPYSSLPRQKGKKDNSNQANSKDSSSSSVTTPSSSSTIFPLSLNSPSSPMKPTGKTETPSSLKLPAAIFNAIYRSNSNRTAPKASEDYTSMDYETTKSSKSKSSKSDYMNYAPAAAPSRSEPDYAVMHPGALDTAKVTTLPVKSVSSDSASPLIGHLSTIGIKENQSMVFCPIKEDSRTGSTMQDESRKPEESPQGYHLPESPYEILRGGECVSPAAKISRPNSVNGDSSKNPTNNNSSPRAASTADRSLQDSPSGTTRTSLSRPSSTSSEQWSSSSTVVGGSRPESANSEPSVAQLHYASLDLAAQAEEEDARSSRAARQLLEAAQLQAQPETTSVYAEIDFIMSEGLKQSSNQSLLNNTKVKH